MTRLSQYKDCLVSLEQSKNVKGGGEDTAGGDTFFGYGTSNCDWKGGNGGCTYYFDDPERWRLAGDCK